MHQITLSPEAEEDLENIKNIISIDNPIIADKVIDRISQALSNIAFFPLLGKKRGLNFRELIEPNYKFRIVYKIKDEEIEIEEIEIEVISIFKNKNLF